MFTKTKIALAVIAFTLLYITFNLSDWERNTMLTWDPSGYYLYLPAVFIYNDIGKLDFYDGITEKYFLNNGNKSYGLYREPTGLKLNKYSTGTCILEMPFFLIGHFCCINFPGEKNPPDGYSEPYRQAVIFSGVFWVLAGLFVLRRFLLKYFSEAATAITLLLLAFGTNLYFYTVFVAGMSHPYSFALFCFLLSTTDDWYRNERKINVILMGMILGLIVITRPTNILIAILPLCWKYKDGRLSGKLLFYKRQLPTIILAALVFFLVLMIQFSYWKYVTGDWIHFSYEEEGFNFLDPQIWNGLFSYRKGWFLYTPVAFIGVAGLILLAKKQARLAVIIAIYLAINIYVVFSWCNWPYGGSFGCRALIESIAVVAIPLTMLTDWVFAKKKIALNIILLTVFAFFITLNAFQSYQLINNITAWDGTNRAFYWTTFGKLKVNYEDRNLLLQK